jgi:hypothetical protein
LSSIDSECDAADITGLILKGAELVELEVGLGVIGAACAAEGVSSLVAFPLAAVAVEQDGWMRSAGLGNVLYVDPRDVYL